MNKNRFTAVPSAEDAINAMRDLASPVGAFVRDTCVIGSDDENEISVDLLYQAYKVWAEDNGHKRDSKQTFGRNLHAAVPSVSVKRPRDHETKENKRPRVYVGISLKPTSKI
jgi:putative DNA primase/helicase